VRANNSFFIGSNAKTASTSTFPYQLGREITADGLIDDWGGIDNLTLAYCPRDTRELPGAIVNASAFASGTQLAFYIALSRSLADTRALHPSLNLPTHFVGAVDWWHSGYYYSYSCNFYLDSSKHNVIIYAHDLPEGGSAIDEFAVGEDQWAFNTTIEFYLTSSQAEHFFDLYPADDYGTYFSTELGWIYELKQTDSGTRQSESEGICPLTVVEVETVVLLRPPRVCSLLRI
jgi:hypothetical protein